MLRGALRRADIVLLSGGLGPTEDDVTRDPVARYVSGFDSRLRQGAPSRHAPWRGDEEWAFSQFPDPNSLALALNPEHPAHQNALRAMHGITHIQTSAQAAEALRPKRLLSPKARD